MTVLRREDVQSRIASWNRSSYRMLSPPILAIVPLILRRLRGPSLTCVMVSGIHAAHESVRNVSERAEIGAGWSAAHRKPASSRAIATAILGAGL